MVLQNLTDELLFYMDAILKSFLQSCVAKDFEIFSTWAAFLMVELGSSEKHFSTSSTVSSITTVYKGPGASYLRPWRVLYTV